jgi:hypothetical protein
MRLLSVLLALGLFVLFLSGGCGSSDLTGPRRLQTPPQQTTGG